MMTPSSGSTTQMLSKDRFSDVNDAVPAPRTGILSDISEGEFRQDSEVVSACEGMFELDTAFKRIDEVMTWMQEWSVKERDEMILNLTRSLWNLHMARHHIKRMEEENKLLNLASAPRSTEINTSHGHATAKVEDEIKGTMVPNTEVNLVEDQYERSVEDILTNAKCFRHYGSGSLGLDPT